MEIFRPRKRENSSTHIYFLIVPLYLVILIFFIIINTISPMGEENKFTTLLSVAKKFSGKQNISEKGDIEDIPEQEFTKNLFFNKMFDIFREFTYENDFNIRKLDNILYVTIPIERGFKPDSPELRHKFKTLLEQLFKLYGNNLDKIDFRFKVILGSKQITNNQLLLERLTSLNLALNQEEQYNPITIGFEQGNVNIIKFELKF